MSEIEKLYSLAGIESVGFNPYKLKDEYPPFTAEKQIELIKWLAKNKQGFGLDYYAYSSSSVWECGVQFEWEVYKQRFEHSEFSESLSGLINDLWQDLTEARQNEIKDILKGVTK